MVSGKGERKCQALVPFSSSVFAARLWLRVMIGVGFLVFSLTHFVLSEESEDLRLFLLCFFSFLSFFLSFHQIIKL